MHLTIPSRHEGSGKTPELFYFVRTLRSLLGLVVLLLVAGCGDSDGNHVACTSLECGDHGSCVEQDGGESCACDEGYAGDSCDECATGYEEDGDECFPEEAETGNLCEGNPCGTNGTCSARAGAIVCACKSGYQGDRCGQCSANYHKDGSSCVRDAACGANSCPDNAACDDASGLVVCACEAGYRGADCDECAAGYHDDAGACVADETCRGTTCNRAGDCSDDSGIPECACDIGYAGDHCEICAGGFVSDGTLCVAEDASCGDDTCALHASCADDAGTLECVCHQGYDGADCDECASGFVLEDRRCVADEGGSSCEPGFVSVDGMCVEQEPGCASDDNCAPTGQCDDTSGDVVCVCDTGYSGDVCDECAPGYHASAVACVKDTTCRANTCAKHGSCDDDSGAPVCECATGYRGANCTLCAQGFSLGDAGECIEDEACEVDSCSGRGFCSVTLGQRSCACAAGYTGATCAECALGFHANGTACDPDRSCSTTSCSRHGECSDDEGVVVCDCETGYAGNNCELCDEDFTRANNQCIAVLPDRACGQNSCSGNGTCDGSSGTAVCTCTGGHAGVRCQSCASGRILIADGSCAVSTCGDGLTDSRKGETCDDGNAVTEECGYGLSCVVCNAQCQVSAGVANGCGDGNVDTGEECDDGGLNSDDAPDACRSNCVLPGCGDGVLDSGEECDASDGVCLPDCTLPELGVDAGAPPDAGAPSDAGGDGGPSSPGDAGTAADGGGDAGDGG